MPQLSEEQKELFVRVLNNIDEASKKLQAAIYDCQRSGIDLPYHIDDLQCAVNDCTSAYESLTRKLN